MAGWGLGRQSCTCTCRKMGLAGAKIYYPAPIMGLTHLKHAEEHVFI